MAEDAKKGLEYAEAANKQIRIFWLIWAMKLELL
jgi:hypothetical protein